MDLPETLWALVCNLQIITLQCDKINLQETLHHCHYSQGLWAMFKSRFFYSFFALRNMKYFFTNFLDFSSTHE